MTKKNSITERLSESMPSLKMRKEKVLRRNRVSKVGIAERNLEDLKKRIRFGKGRKKRGRKLENQTSMGAVTPRKKK